MGRPGHTVVMWRDRFDAGYFSLGVRTETGIVIKWVDLWDNSFIELFGDAAYVASQRLTPGGEPVEVVLTLTFSAEAGR